MAYGIMAAVFQYIQESQHIAFDVCKRVFDGIAYACLTSEVDHGIEMFCGE